MPDNVSTETNDDLRADLSAEFDRLAAENEAPEAETAKATPEAEALKPGETEEARAERVRDEKGRFVKKTAAETALSPAEQPATLEPAPQQQSGQAQQTAPVGPPSSWSIAAKAEFDKLPPPVKEAIAKREQEAAQGFTEYQTKFAAYKGLEPYAEMATRAGTTLPQAVQAWMNAEELLHRDFEQGMLSLCQHFNVNPQALAARWVGGGSQQPNGQGSQMPAYVQQELNALKAEVAQFRQAQEQQHWSGVTSEIDAFKAKPENKYFENVKPFMAKLLQTEAATSLQDAYEQACWAHPEIRSLLIKEQQAANAAEAQRKASEARRAAGSLNPGSPIPGASTGSGSSPKTLREELLANYDAHAV